MENTKATIETLNDLVQINNDRIAGYNRALAELKDDDRQLKNLFTTLIGDSHQYKMALATEIAALHADIATDTTTSGKIHRAWLNVKATFSGHDKKSILEECEFGEDAIKKAYSTAIEEEHLPAFIKDIIAGQLNELHEAHDEIKALRDSAA